MKASITAIALSAFLLSACVDSAAPILTDSKPLFGQTFRMQLFGLRKGVAHDPEQATYAWDGARYRHTDGGMSDIRAFTVHPFEEGNSIVQSVSDEGNPATEYALMRRLADGVYLVTPVDEGDAGEATRAANCRDGGKSSCRVETQAQLMALARASATKHKDSGGLVIRLPDRD